MAKANPAVRKEEVEFNGIVFRRYPDSKRMEDRRYFKPHAGHIKRGVEALHREIWKAHHGPIPDGYHIHHRNGDTGDNRIENLECLPAGSHLSYHGNQPDRVEAARQNIELARNAASAWHRSEAGRAWHSQHGREAWVARQPIKHVCDQCGREYESLIGDTGSRFCSNNCKSAWRRASGTDDVQRACEYCGAEFTSNRYNKTRFCSGSCAAKHRNGSQRKTAE